MVTSITNQRSSLCYTDSQRSLWISEGVVEVLLAHRQCKNDPESGGIVLGQVYSNRDEILDITRPSQYDKRKRFSFVRSRIPAQRSINRAWADSDGKLIYLGEWHTHPEVSPCPSTGDHAMIARQLKMTIMEISHLYLLVVGQKNSLWVGRRDTAGLRELTITD